MSSRHSKHSEKESTAEGALKAMEIITAKFNPYVSYSFASPAGSATVFALSYDDLQEIHTLTGLVLTWRMNLPTKMINQAQEVAARMIKLRQVKPNASAATKPDQP